MTLGGTYGNVPVSSCREICSFNMDDTCLTSNCTHVMIQDESKQKQSTSEGCIVTDLCVSSPKESLQKNQQGKRAWHWSQRRSFFSCKPKTVWKRKIEKDSNVSANKVSNVLSLLHLACTSSHQTLPFHLLGLLFR